MKLKALDDTISSEFLWKWIGLPAAAAWAIPPLAQIVDATIDSAEELDQCAMIVGGVYYGVLALYYIIPPVNRLLTKLMHTKPVPPDKWSA